MKQFSVIRWVASVLVVLGTVSAYAQSGDTDAAATASTAMAPSAKSISAANRQLSKSVRRTLARVKGLNSGSIVVVAQGGVVTLAGSVPDPSQIEVAVSAAKGVKGVNAVSDKLTIKAEGQ